MESLLERLTKISGVRAAAVVDSSGNPISYSGDEASAPVEQLASITPTIAVSLFSASSDLEEMNLGEFKSAIVDYQNSSFILQPVSGGDVFLVVAMDPDSPNLGLVVLHAESVVGQLVNML